MKLLLSLWDGREPRDRRKAAGSLLRLARSLLAGSAPPLTEEELTFLLERVAAPDPWAKRIASTPLTAPPPKCSRRQRQLVVFRQLPGQEQIQKYGLTERQLRHLVPWQQHRSFATLVKWVGEYRLSSRQVAAWCQRLGNPRLGSSSAAELPLKLAKRHLHSTIRVTEIDHIGRRSAEPKGTQSGASIEG